MKNLLALLIISLLFFAACQSEEPVQEERQIPVNVYSARPDTISKYIKLTGSVTGENDAMVYSKVSEKLDKIYVKPGQSVSAGQVLAVQYNAVLRQMVDMAKTALKSARTQYDFVNKDFERMSGLYDQKALSQQQFEQLKTQRETAASAVEQAELQLQQAEENYQNSFIKAPFAGVVGAVMFEEDQMVPAGMPVVQVVSPSAMKSKLKISTSDISAVKAGQQVEVKFPSVPDKVYKAKVTNINYAVDPITNLLEIEVQLLNPDQAVKSGIFGQFLIETSRHEGIIAVPEYALMQRTEIIINKNTGIQETVKKYFVYVVEENTAVLKEVKTGINSEGRYEITGGLKEGDKVIVVGQNVIRDGQKVKIVE